MVIAAAASAAAVGAAATHRSPLLLLAATRKSLLLRIEVRASPKPKCRHIRCRPVPSVTQLQLRIPTTQHSKAVVAQRNSSRRSRELCRRLRRQYVRIVYDSTLSRMENQTREATPRCMTCARVTPSGSAHAPICSVHEQSVCVH